VVIKGLIGPTGIEPTWMGSCSRPRSRHQMIPIKQLVGSLVYFRTIDGITHNIGLYP